MLGFVFSPVLFLQGRAFSFWRNFFFLGRWLFGLSVFEIFSFVAFLRQRRFLSLHLHLHLQIQIHLTRARVKLTLWFRFGSVLVVLWFAFGSALVVSYGINY